MDGMSMSTRGMAASPCFFMMADMSDDSWSSRFSSSSFSSYALIRPTIDEVLQIQEHGQVAMLSHYGRQPEQKLLQILKLLFSPSPPVRFTKLARSLYVRPVVLPGNATQHSGPTTYSPSSGRWI